MKERTQLTCARTPKQSSRRLTRLLRARKTWSVMHGPYRCIFKLTRWVKDRTQRRPSRVTSWQTDGSCSRLTWQVRGRCTACCRMWSLAHPSRSSTPNFTCGCCSCIMAPTCSYRSSLWGSLSRRTSQLTSCMTSSVTCNAKVTGAEVRVKTDRPWHHRLPSQAPSSCQSISQISEACQRTPCSWLTQRSAQFVNCVLKIGLE